MVVGAWGKKQWRGLVRPTETFAGAGVSAFQRHPKFGELTFRKLFVCNELSVQRLLHGFGEITVLAFLSSSVPALPISEQASHAFLLTAHRNIGANAIAD
jgi:hypothetical protein